MNIDSNMLRRISQKLVRHYHVAPNSNNHWSLLDMQELNKSLNHPSYIHMAETNRLLKKNIILLKENNRLLTHINQILYKNSAIPARVEILEKIVHK